VCGCVGGGGGCECVWCVYVEEGVEWCGSGGVNLTLNR